MRLDFQASSLGAENGAEHGAGRLPSLLGETNPVLQCQGFFEGLILHVEIVLLNAMSGLNP